MQQPPRRHRGHLEVSQVQAVQPGRLGAAEIESNEATFRGQAAPNLAQARAEVGEIAQAVADQDAVHASARERKVGGVTLSPANQRAGGTGAPDRHHLPRQIASHDERGG